MKTSKSDIIGSVRSKVELLIADNKRLGEFAEKTCRQRDKLQSENRKLSEKIALLEKRISVLELGDSLSGAGRDTKLARARVNRLMREIDKCIALLNR